MTLGLIQGGPEGTAVTLRAMVKLVRQYRRDPGVMQLARELVRDLRQYDHAGEIKALHAFVRDHIRYTNDPKDVELLQTPRATLEMRTGDCDDKSTLLAALLESIGRPARFVAVGFKPFSNYQHVLVETRNGKGWMPLETIKPVEAGWGPSGVTKRMVAHV
jgi:transglutaminase-like putative cysteine protease